MLYSITHPLNAWTLRRHIRRQLAEIRSRAPAMAYRWKIGASC